MSTIATRRSTTRIAPSWLILALACACQFMVILDAAIVNVALPAIERDLGFTPSGLAWVVDGYLLAFAGFMLLGGRVADLFGHRRVLVSGLLVFASASLVGGLAAVPEVLVGARVAQGIGGALMAPTTLAVINTSFTGARERTRAFGAWSSAGGVGGMAGALAGGMLTTGLSWRWVFLINVPIGAALIALTVIVLGSTRPQRRESLDVAGAILGTAGLAGVIYGVMQSVEHGWASAEVVMPASGGLLLLVGFAVTEARLVRHPMVPPMLFKIRSVVVSNVMLVLFGAITIAMWYFTSLFMQNVLGYSALQTGLGQTPAAVTFVVIARVSAALFPRLGARILVLAGCAFFIVGFGWIAAAHSSSSYLAMVLGPTLFIAIGIGLTFPTLMVVSTVDIPRGQAGIVSGLATTASQVGGSIGLAALATIASSRAATEIEKAGSAPSVALAAGYSSVFLIAAGLSVAIAGVSWCLPRSTRRQAAETRS